MTKFNIGAGSFRHEGWVNVDNPSDWYAEVQGDMLEWDLLSLRPISAESNSASLIYSSHVIEHVTDEAVQNLCNECHRILRPGGLVRFQAPDIDIFFEEFRRGKAHSWLSKKTPTMAKIPLREATPAQAFLWSFASNATSIHKDGAPTRLTDVMIYRAFFEKDYVDALTYCASFVSIEKQKKYPGNHMNWWNPEKLIHMLEQAGFGTVAVSGYGKSEAKEMQNTEVFDFGHKEISFYVEARRGFV